MIPILFGLLLIGILVFAFWWDVYRHKANAQKKRMLKGFMITVVVGLFVLCLFFHIIPSKGRILTKSHPTFEHTFVTEEDLEWFNESSHLQQNVIILSDPFYRRLVEEGVVKRQPE